MVHNVLVGVSLDSVIIAMTISSEIKKMEYYPPFFVCLAPANLAIKTAYSTPFYI